MKTKKKPHSLVENRLVAVNPEIKTWVSSQRLPTSRTGVIQTKTNRLGKTIKAQAKSIRFRQFITYEKLLNRVIKAAHIIQSKGYKVVDIAGSTRKPFEIEKDSKRLEKQSFTSRLFDNFYNRVTDFTIYYRKYKFQEPLAKQLHYELKCFDDFDQTESMREFLASFMQTHQVLCHVDITDTGSLRDTLKFKPGHIKTTKTTVIIFYYRE